jgi:thiamine biosynthesis lipoprotein
MSGSALPGKTTAVGLREFSALGTTAFVATTDPDVIESASMILHEELMAIDRACSRFRPDSEISGVLRRAGATVEVSPLLSEAVETALRVAQDTEGAVDPTVGAAVIALGYDRDFSEVRRRTRNAPVGPGPRAAPGWECVELDPVRNRLRVPSGVVLDLGATAKALAADRAVSRIAAATGSGALVNLGGDVSLAGGAPPGGWAVGIALESSAAPRDSRVVVAIREGGLASSGTAVRTWLQGDRRVHHIIDPETGDAAASWWRLVSVTAPSCVEANAVSTSAIVWGASAVERLSARGLPCRLVGEDGSVVVLGGWPADGPPPPGATTAPAATAAPTENAVTTTGVKR